MIGGMFKVYPLVPRYPQFRYGVYDYASPFPIHVIPIVFYRKLAPLTCGKIGQDGTKTIPLSELPCFTV
jgi:hypothetical protein